MSSARPRWPRLLLAAVLAVAGATLLSARTDGTVGLPQANQRSLTITVLDKSGAPVADLAVGDVIVREDGVAREIVRVALAPPPTEVVILADDTQAAAPTLRDLREALNAFANTMADQAPPPAMRLATFGDRPTTLVDFNPSFSAISRGIDRIVTRPGSGATLLEAIDESASALQRRKAQRPVIVAFVSEAGPEFGNLRHTNIAAALQRANASLWTIVLTQRGGGGSSDAERERNMVLGDVTRQSGGRNAQILASQNIPDAFATLARQLTTRWEVTYGRPDALIPPSKLEIEARDSAQQVLSPRWAGR